MLTSAILAARERRYQKKLRMSELLKKTVVSITVNVPHEMRLSKRCLLFHREMVGRVRLYLQNLGYTPENFVCDADEDGPYVLFALSASALTTKRLCVTFENNEPGGRLLDIDVLADGLVIGREEIGQKRRRCFLCSRPAHECVAYQRHDRVQIISRVEEMLKVALS